MLGKIGKWLGIFAAGDKAPTVINTRYVRAMARGPLARWWQRFNRAADLRPDVREFNDAGYVVVKVDARGSGASTGSRQIEWSQDEVADYGEVVDNLLLADCRSDRELTRVFSFIERRPMKRTRLTLVLLSLALLSGVGQGQTPSQPNIILVVADDLGWRDVGYQGSDFYETPQIDRLAKLGMVFPQGYAGAGNCAPSRAVMISGQYGPRHGVYAVNSTERGPVELMRLEPIPNRSGLALPQVTMAEALQAAGYRTGIFGKWHLGGKDGAEPGEQGFDVVFNSRPDPNRRRDEPEDPKGIYSLTRAAIDFMDSTVNSNRPFFLLLTHHAIHTALESRPSSLAHFKAKRPGAQHRETLYAACLADLDDGVGRLVARLREMGQDRRTLFIFTSDNGGTQQSSQEPLRGNKGSYYEGGIRVPFIAWWPGVIRPGTVNQTPVHNVDLYPTFLEVAGLATPPGKVLDGVSLLPLFKGAGELKRNALFWHFPGYLDTPVIRGRDKVFRSRPVSVIRKGDWKLHLYHEEWILDGGREKLATNKAVELYRLDQDTGEHRNLANRELGKRDELLGDLWRWIKEVNAPLPTVWAAGSSRR